ncbi:MAG: hypothetical protein K0R17_3656 [Rariglobus sp.]|nr:hypothetical protein [Rariglobus sp.]
MDWVANHTAWDHPWLANRNWYLRDRAGNALSPPGKGWDDVAQLNYKNTALREAMIKAMQFWVVNTEVDGFRCDFADGPPFDFWKATIASARNATKRKLFFLAESGTRELYEAGFDCISGFDFYNNLKQVYWDKKPAKIMDLPGGNDRPNISDRKPEARYISNNDLLAIEGPTATVFENERGAMAAFVLACMQGPPMIYNGQEGLAEKSVGVYPADYTSEQVNPEYKKILAIRKNSNAIKRGRLTSYSNDDVYVIKKDYEKERALVICNLRNKKVTYSVPDFLSIIPWVDAFSQNRKQLGKTIEMEPFGYFILKASSP